MNHLSLIDQRAPAIGCAGDTMTNARRLQNTLASYRPTITKTFENGVISFAEGELSLGVTYDLLVTGVNGYATVNNWTYQAGFDGNPTFFLERLTGVAGAPEILYTNFAGVTENVTADGSLVIAFDRDVELVLDQVGTIAVLNDRINDTLQAQDEAGIIPANEAGDSMTDTGTGLVPNTAINQHGVSVTVTGSVLTIRWSGNANLAAPSMNQTPANRICYGALADVRVRATGTAGEGTAITQVQENAVAAANEFSAPGGTECIRFRASQAAASAGP